MSERIVCFIMDTVKADDGGYLVCLAVEGEKGYYKTDWNWGHNKDRAQLLCDERNQACGIDKKEAYIIQMKTM